MTHCEKNVVLRTLLLGFALPLLALQACVTEGSTRGGRYERFLGARLEEEYLKTALDSFRLEPLASKHSEPGQTTLRVVDASSWGRGVLTVRLDSSDLSRVHGQVAAEGWEADSGRKTRTRRELATAEVRMVGKCVQHLRKAGAFIDARRAPIPETVTVDGNIVLIELINERGYAIGIWPGNSPNWIILRECLTKFYQLTGR